MGLRLETGRSAPAIAALLLVSFLACRDRAEHPATPATSADGGASHRGGIKVPLPPGWSARATAEESLVAGPPGRTVLRIALWSEGARSLPSPQTLAEGFRRRSTGLAVEVVDQQEDAAHALVVLNVRPVSDAGAGQGWVTLLGATKLGEDLFLCSTTPGATEDEVKASAAACGALSRTDPPKR